MIKVLPIEKKKTKPYYYISGRVIIGKNTECETREYFPNDFITMEDAEDLIRTWKKWHEEGKIGIYGINMVNINIMYHHLFHDYLVPNNDYEKEEYAASKEAVEDMMRYHGFTKDDLKKLYTFSKTFYDLFIRPVEYSENNITWVKIKYVDEYGDTHDCEVED